MGRCLIEAQPIDVNGAIRITDGNGTVCHVWFDGNDGYRFAAMLRSVADEIDGIMRERAKKV